MPKNQNTQAQRHVKLATTQRWPCETHQAQTTNRTMTTTQHPTKRKQTSAQHVQATCEQHDEPTVAAKAKTTAPTTATMATIDRVASASQTVSFMAGMSSPIR